MTLHKDTHSEFSNAACDIHQVLETIVNALDNFQSEKQFREQLTSAEKQGYSALYELCLDYVYTIEHWREDNEDDKS